jgi:two-component system sensor histidine kinase/response regulator
MTSMAQRGHAARSQQAGISGFLNKPVRQSQLYDCLTTVLGPTLQAVPEAGLDSSKIVTAHSLKEAHDLRRLRILLAEDNQTNQMAAVRMLEMLGYQIDVAVNGIEAVDACRNVEYGLVLMDNQMPEMDGITAAREVRKFELAHGKPPVPIIALTADAMQGDREKCLAAGMNDYLSKPFKMVQLTEMLERWGGRPPSAAPVLSAARPAPRESAVDSRVLDEFRKTGPAGAASDFVTQLIDQYLAEATLRMAALKDALERRDGPALRLATHSLRGTSSTVGANRLAGMCEELEARARAVSFDRAPALLTAIEEEFKRVREALLETTELATKARR